MKLRRLDGEFTVCKVPSAEGLDLSRDFTFFSRTDEELSLVCPSAHAPASATSAEPGWRCLKILGPLDFGMTGVIAGISGILAEHKIPVFVISTFDTDYVLVKKDLFDAAVRLLKESGYEIAS